VFRLNAAGTAWDDIGGSSDSYQKVGDIADLAGAPVVGFAAAVGDSSAELRAQTLGAGRQVESARRRRRDVVQVVRLLSSGRRR
jgi:hypothetical protein